MVGGLAVLGVVVWGEGAVSVDFQRRWSGFVAGALGRMGTARGVEWARDCGRREQ